MSDEETKKELATVAVLIDELRHDDVQVRLNSVKKLQTISKALGPVRTRDELVPYLNEFIDDEDDILLALAEELGHLIDLVGGVEYAHALFIPLETLSSVEETVVREKAVESIIKIIQVISVQNIIQFLIPMLQRLSSGEWFTARISACGLYAATYAKLVNTPNIPNTEQIKLSLRNTFAILCRDDTPMVRRAACSHIGHFASSMEYESVKSDVIPSFEVLAEDEQDSVRLLTVEDCILIGKSIKPDDNEQKIVPIIHRLCTDKSWRVRYMIADKFLDLLQISRARIGIGLNMSTNDEKQNNLTDKESVERDRKTKEMVDHFVHLLSDAEPEVRTAAANRVADVSRAVGASITLSKLIAPCQQLVGDSCQYTRASLAKVIMGLATVLEKQDVYDQLLPLFLRLLKDTHPEVRLNIISKLDSVNQVIGIDLLSQALLPAIVELAMDPKWRIRLAIINHIPLLAGQLGTTFFEEKLSDLCMDWLGDQVHSIRQAATQNLTKLAQVFGAQWSQSHILPKVIDLSSNSSYLYRMTALTALMDLCVALGKDVTTNIALPVIVKMADDSVPNVRFNVAKTITHILPFLSPSSIQTLARPCLKKLYSDSDSDVQYFAAQALKLIGMD